MIMQRQDFMQGCIKIESDQCQEPASCLSFSSTKLCYDAISRSVDQSLEVTRDFELFGPSCSNKGVRRDYPNSEKGGF